MSITRAQTDPPDKKGDSPGLASVPATERLDPKEPKKQSPMQEAPADVKNNADGDGAADEAKGQDNNQAADPASAKGTDKPKEEQAEQDEQPELIQTGDPDPNLEEPSDKHDKAMRPMNIIPDQVADSKKIEVAGFLMERMGDHYEQIENLFNEAEKKSDQVKRNCLSPKLEGVGEAIATAATAFEAMRVALGSRQSITASKEYKIIYEASLKCDHLATESQSCMGAVYTGSTVLSANVDIKRLPVIDPTAVPTLLDREDVKNLDRPVCVSCYK